MGSSIVVAGQLFDIEHPVVTFQDPGGFDAYLKRRFDDPTAIYPTHPAAGMENKEARFRERRFLQERTVSALKKGVRQVVVHLDGCIDAKMCFHVLHNQHGLSVHFLVDNDGTIYQTLDLADCAFHAAGVNERSIGIELQNRGDAGRFPDAYRFHPDWPKRDTVTCTVHDELFLAYDYTRAQYEAMTRLSVGLARVLDIPFTAPRGPDGAPHRTLLPAPAEFAGYIGHYNVTREKWDPGPWDFQRMFRRVASRITFPLTSPERLQTAGQLDPTRFEREAEDYFRQTEVDSPGHFPVGPAGESRLWHGGVHLVGAVDEPVYTSIPGRVVAARYSAPSPFGSTSFLLMKHALETDQGPLPFFSLYVHLRPETGGVEPPPWLVRTPELGDAIETGRTMLLGTSVAGGELLGHLGEAGPPEERRPQVHFAIFAETNFAAALDPESFRLIDGGATSRFANRDVVRLVDRGADGKPPDGLLSRRELIEFFRRDRRREDLRRVVVRHLSEWTTDGWESAIEGAPDFRELSAGERRQLLEQQIKPTLWWSDSVGRHAGLPADGVVFAYHPIGFLAWYENWARKRAEERSRGIATARGNEVVGARASAFKLDFESTTQMTDAEDIAAPPPRRGLTLDEMLEGYGE